MTKSKVEAILQKEREKALAYMICRDLKPLYLAEVATKSYPVGYVTPQF